MIEDLRGEIGEFADHDRLDRRRSDRGADCRGGSVRSGRRDSSAPPWKKAQPMTVAAEATGSVRAYPLPKLLFYLYRKQFTGTMVLSQSPLENRIYLRDGMPVAAQVADMTEPMGRILLEMGIITDELYNQSLAQMAASGQRQGDILVAIGAVTEEQVAQALKTQLVRKVVRLFKLREAEFALFREDHEYGRTPVEAAGLRVHPRRLIYNGIRNCYDIERVREEIGDGLDGRMFQLDPNTAPNLDRYQFSEEDGQLLALLHSQPWSVRPLREASGASETEIWMMVYTLLVTDMLSLVQVGAAAGPGASDEVARAASPAERPVATPVP